MKKTYSQTSHTRAVPQQQTPEPHTQCLQPSALTPQFSELIHPTHRKMEMCQKAPNSIVRLNAQGSAKQYNSSSIILTFQKSRNPPQPLYPQPAPSPLPHRQLESTLTKN
eukprot:scaffold33979_cov96-Attheya_sp.AAC.1